MSYLLLLFFCFWGIVFNHTESSLFISLASESVFESSPLVLIHQQDVWAAKDGEWPISLFRLATNRYVKNVTNLITFIYFNKNGYSMSILWIEMLGNLLVKEGKKHFMSLSLSNSNSYQCGVRKMISAITLHCRMLQYGRSATNDHSIHLFLQVWVYRHCWTSSNIRWSVYSPLSSWRLFTWRMFIWRQMM